MDNKQIRDLIEDVVSDVPDGLACYDAYEQGKCDEERRIYRALMAKFPLAVKPAVVPWEDSKIGDVVEIGDKFYLLNRTGATLTPCSKCCFTGLGTCPLNEQVGLLCDHHPSCCGIYFTEVDGCE